MKNAINFQKEFFKGLLSLMLGKTVKLKDFY